MTRRFAFLALALALAGCGDSNPLIGKWALARGQRCLAFGHIEFTEKTISLEGMIVPVTYDHDGDKQIAKTSNGAFVFTVNGDTLRYLGPVTCTFTRVRT